VLSVRARATRAAGRPIEPSTVGPAGVKPTDPPDPARQSLTDNDKEIVAEQNVCRFAAAAITR